MATISRIISLPSQTNYIPDKGPNFEFGDFGTSFDYADVPFGSSASIGVNWSPAVYVVPPEPSVKNLSSSKYRFLLTKDSDGSIVRDSELGGYYPQYQATTTSLGSVVTGEKYKVQIYGYSNDTFTPATSAPSFPIPYKVFNGSTPTFTAQTAPNLSPFHNGYAISGTTFRLDGVQHSTVNWGGSPNSFERYYRLEIVRVSDNQTVITALNTNQTTSTDSVISINFTIPETLVKDYYRIFLVAGTRGGAAARKESFVTENTAGSYFGNYPAPTYTSLSPAFGSGNGGTTVTINGNYLDIVSSVTFDGRPAIINSKTVNQLSVTTPWGTAGAKNVVITSSSGSVTAGSAFNYTSTAVGRTCTSFNYNFFVCSFVGCCCAPSYGSQVCSGSSCSPPSDSCAY